MRRIVVVGLLGGVAVVGAYVVVRTRRDAVLIGAGDPPEWPPLPPIEPVVAVEPAAVDQPPALAATDGATWVEPLDGACPLTHPVKGNVTSGIYHVPGGRFYDGTKPGRCYLDAATAEADGLRASKR